MNLKTEYMKSAIYAGRKVFCMKASCSKDCKKKRKADCHDTCPAYRIYRHNQLKEYRKRRLIIDSSGDSNVKRKLIINKIKCSK